MLRSATWIRIASFTTIIGGSAVAQTTTRASVSSTGEQGIGVCRNPMLSHSGRFVSFETWGSGLVPGDTNATTDVFVHDRETGTTERISVTTTGSEVPSPSVDSAISGDGRYVGFSNSYPMAWDDTNNAGDIFVRDRVTNTTERVSLSSAGAQGNDFSYGPSSLSADGRFVAFTSHATNLVAGDTNSLGDVFVRDRQAGTTERVSISSTGAQADSSSIDPIISGDGRYVAFKSWASNLVAGDTNADEDVFVHDRHSGATERVSVDSFGMQIGFPSYLTSLSSDGRFVAFLSLDANVVPGDNNGSLDVFVRDRIGQATERASLDSSGSEGNSDSFHAALSADGRYVTFYSRASNFSPNDSNGVGDIFVRDRLFHLTMIQSIDSTGVQANGDNGTLPSPSVSADGRFVAFTSVASNLVPGDTNNQSDVFLHDRGPSPPFNVSSFCFGDGSGVACPCGNTGQVGRGCENSIATGGAVLAGNGEPLLSADTLILTASGERPTSVSVFWQGGSGIAPRPFGDGVGCMGPPLKRLYARNAVGGVVSAPQGSDLSISARSAVVGDPIIPGTPRIYHTFYRDGGAAFCPEPAGSSFNVTSGLRVVWGP
ncbi:MAG: TolB family protein [Planctomycetota bacterium]